MFHDPYQFRLVHELQSRWRLIRQEYLELSAPLLDIRLGRSLGVYVETLLKRNGWTMSWQIEDPDAELAWLTYALSFKRMQPDDLPHLMPTTSRVLASLMEVHLAALSLVRPGSFITPQAHPVSNERRLTLLLGLDLVPQRSFLCVGNDMREQSTGQVLIFDGTQQHFAVNMSKADSVALYVEFDPGTAAFAVA